MRKVKPMLRALGLSVFATVVLIAFGAGSAQAGFRILGSAALAAGATFTGASEGAIRKLIPGRNLTIKCESADVLEGKFISSTEGLAKVLFLGCNALVLSKESEEVAGCTISNGKTITALAKVLPVTHEEKSFILAEPDGSILTTVQFESGKGCALPLKNEIKGSFAAELNSPEASVLLGTANQAVQKLLGAKILFGTFEAFVDGSATVELTGAHKGCKFGIV